MFWIWDENNVDNILVLLVAKQSRIFQLLLLAWPDRCIGSWEGTQLGQLTQTGERGILFHMMSCCIYNLGELAGGSDCYSGMAWILFIWWQAIAFVHHLFYYYYYVLLCFPVKLSLSQAMSFHFSHSPPHPMGCGRGMSMWLSGA